MIPRIVAVLLAGCVAAGVGWATRPTQAAPEPAVDLELPTDCGARRQVVVEERERLDEAIALARLRLRLQEARRMQREGPALGWPEDLAPRFQPSTFQAAVREAAAAEGYEVLGFDCDEYPCFAAVRIAEPQGDDGNSSSDYAPLFAALRERGHERDVQQVSVIGGGAVRYAVFALHAQEDDDGFAKRQTFRSRALLARIGEQLGVSP